MLVAAPNGGGYAQFYGGPTPLHQANVLRTTDNSMPIQNTIVPNAGLPPGQNCGFAACCDPYASPDAQTETSAGRTSRPPTVPWGRALPSPPWNISIAPTPQRAQARASQNHRRTSHIKKQNVTEPEGLLCPITQVMFQDPCFVPESGNTYERAAIEQYWETVPQPRDPLTNTTLSNTTLYSNWGMRREVQRFLDEHKDYLPQGWSNRAVPPAASPVPAPTMQQQQQQQQPPQQQRRRHSAERRALTEDEQLQWAMRESVRASSRRGSRRRARSTEAVMDRAVQLGSRGTAAARAAMRAFAAQVRRGLLAVRAA